MKLKGLSHLALVCGDMARTVEFYERRLGLELTKTMELPDGMGQHFFFDIGNGDCLAFFYFRDGCPGVEGQTYPATYRTPSADGSMHHVAIEIESDDLVGWYDRLTAAGVEFDFVAHHVDRPSDHRIADIAEDTYAASMYLKDPDGTVIEFCAWLPPWDRFGRHHEPVVGDR